MTPFVCAYCYNISSKIIKIQIMQMPHERKSISSQRSRVMDITHGGRHSTCTWKFGRTGIPWHTELMLPLSTEEGPPDLLA